MTSLNEEERSLRAYLLGETALEEQRQIEERLLSDSDYVELLLIIEEALIDGYVGDTLSEREREQVEKHVLTTPKQWRKLRKAKALRRYVDNAQPFPVAAPVSRLRSNRFWKQPLLTPAWRSAIAALLVLGLAIGVWRVFIHQSLADKGRAALQAALHDSPTEARIAGLNWPPQQITLGEQPNHIADKTSLESAERYLLDAVTAQPGPDSRYALGQFYLAKGDLNSAIEQFDQGLAEMPNNARLHSDLGAALLEKARRETAKVDQRNSAAGNSDLLPQSLEHLNRALELDGTLLEALYNRALCYQHMQALSLAETDWRAYLSRDANSLWADEARRHLKETEDQKQKASQNNQAQFNNFLSAYQAGDRATAWKIVSQTRDLIAGRLIWWQLLNNFFERLAASQLVEANAWIDALQYVGKLELHLGAEAGQPKGDPYVSELAASYRSSSPQQRAGLLSAHQRINEGHQLYLNNQYGAALGHYTQARQDFARLGDRGEALLADLLISYCHIQDGEIAQSRSQLEQLVGECREKGYLWLLGQSSFSLAMVQDRLAEHSQALINTSQALEISEKISDGYNIQRSLAQIADQYRKLGNYELATSYLNRCLEQVSAAWPGDRQMWRNCDQLTQVFNAKRLNAAAAAYASEALRLALEMKDPTFTYISYVHLALLHSKQEDYAGAIHLAQLGVDAAPDDSCRAYAALQLGHVRSQAGDWQQALYAYDQSIKYIDLKEAEAAAHSDHAAWSAKTNNLPALRYDAHKGRLFCLFAQGEAGPAQEELARTLELLEKHRENILEEQNRNTFFNVEQSVYDAAINFEYARRADNPAVFDYSEESRARSLLEMITIAQAQAVQAKGEPQDSRPLISHPLRLAEVQPWLPEQTQLIEYVVLNDKLLICRVSKSAFSVKAVPIRLSDLTDKVLNFRRSLLRHTSEPLVEAQELYNLLIKPIELSPENGRQLCIVPDKILNNLPFAALASPDSGSYLIEDYDLTVDPSATIYLVCSERTGHTTDRDHERLLAVGDPTFDSTLPALPSTRQQVEKIAELYPSKAVLTGDDARAVTVKREMETSDVIHLASHYVVYEGNPMNSRLLLAQEPGDRGASDRSAGFLQADEVYGLKLRRAPLVILSACQSGVEHYYNGEGMIGMSRVFIAAGAPVVVASLWPVDVFATDDLMISFHRHRKLEGLSASEALKSAQQDMLRNPAKRHPYYWAGFTVIGGHPGF
ncbi:MAG: CHAT domain-containing protein [Blastocatellia bacterium]